MEGANPLDTFDTTRLVSYIIGCKQQVGMMRKICRKFGFQLQFDAIHISIGCGCHKVYKILMTNCWSS